MTGQDLEIREIKRDRYRVCLDLSPQILALSLQPDYAWDPESGLEPVPTPTPKGAISFGSPFLCASMLALKAKQFDDGLYAAVDLAAQHGLGKFEGKIALLRTLARELANSTASDVAIDTLLGAAQLGGIEIPDRHRATDAVAGFLDNPLRSKPISFYTWSEELSRIFRQDRLLQEPLEGREGIAAIAQALRKAPKSYEAYLTLISRLTNPLVAETPDFRAVPEGFDRGVCFFPPSRAQETDRIQTLFQDQPIPEGFDLVGEMIRRIRSGSLDLRPTAASGWYDYQTWALEPLVRIAEMPEGARLRWNDEYLEELENLFRSILALTRETHIKQLEIPLAACAPPEEGLPSLILRPELSLEPLPSYYARRAKGYEFVHEVLEESFGPGALKSMKGWRASGPREISLEEELTAITKLFGEAATQASWELGLSIATRPGTGLASVLDRDPDLSQDARMMVPVYFDAVRNKTKVWMFLGWAGRTLGVAFHAPPSVSVFEQNGKPARVRVEFESTAVPYVYPIVAEAHVTTPMNRDEFRAHCDRHQTKSAILAAL